MQCAIQFMHLDEVNFLPLKLHFKISRLRIEPVCVLRMAMPSLKSTRRDSSELYPWNYYNTKSVVLQIAYR